MHLELLVEGQTDLTALSIILPEILGTYGSPHTWRIHKHRGVGELPENSSDKPDPRNPTLLHNLPASLRAYGKSLEDSQAVVVLVDLDDRDCIEFKKSMKDLLIHCSPKPLCLFRIAIEELEAWFLGDKDALSSAYPKANSSVWETYVQDSICGTWELIADAIYPGGVRALKAKGRQAPLEEKRLWARSIAPRMDINNNNSPSFRAFRDGILRLVAS